MKLEILQSSQTCTPKIAKIKKIVPENPPFEDVFPILKIGLFQCHASFLISGV